VTQMHKSIDQIVLASGNAGKLAEFSNLFESYQINIVAQGELGVADVPETGTTFVENAIIKARHAARVTGLPALSDDSGLVVSALGGAPGIYSSRYSASPAPISLSLDTHGHELNTNDLDACFGTDASDQKNIEKLLLALGDTPERKAHFICVLVFMRHADDPTPIICQGHWHGAIATQAAGTEGFGYDPIFYCPTLGKHAAECAKAEKATVSHRAKALRLLLSEMSDLLG